jgi:hypothetical protein
MWRAATGRPVAGSAAMADGSLARLFRCVLDDLDYGLTQAKLWTVGMVWGPEPETAADEPDSEQLQKAFPKIGIAFRHQGDGRR